MPIKHKFKVAGKEFEEVLSYAKAIRKHCLDCCAGSADEVRICHLETCPLFPFRFGKDPGKAKRVVTDAQRAAGRESMKRLRERNGEGIPTHE